MQDADVQALTATVLWAGFGLAAVFGAVAARTRFCTMGAVADIVAMGDWSRMRMWVLAMAVAIVGFNGMVAAGWVEARHSLYAGPRLAWLSSLVGGAMFGLGMVLASGCGSRNLVRLGGGSLKALVVLLVMAVAAFATLKGLTAVWRVHTVDRVGLQLPHGQDLPTLVAGMVGWPVPATALALGLGVGGALAAWVLWRPEGREAATWLGGAGTGLVIVGLWWVSGRLGYVPEHPQTLEPAFLATASRRMEALSMAAPLAGTLEALLFFSDRALAPTLGVVAVLGVVAGSLAVALTTRSFRWEGFGGVDDIAHHLVGAVLMGVGGVTALGCSIGQGLSGVSTLALGSGLALAAMIGGAVLGLRYQQWRL